MSVRDIIQAAAGVGGAAETDPNFKQTVLLLHGDGTNGAQNNTFLDSSTNNFTITRNGNTTQGTFSPFSLAAGEWSNFFDGTGDSLQIANNAAFNLGTGDFTIEAWIYLTADAAQNAGGIRGANIFTAIPTSGTVNGYALYLNGSSTTTGTGLIFANTVSSVDYAATYTATITKNTWHHVAVARSGTTTKLFFNGAEVASTTLGNQTVSNSTNATGVGASFYTGYTNNFPGYLSNVRIVKGRAVYTSAFTPSTVPLGATSGGQNPPQGTETSLLTCQSNRFVDNGVANSGTGFTITRNGDVRVTPFSPFAPSAAYSAGTNGGSGYFDGNTDYLTAASNAAFAFGTGDFTIEAWINPASLAADTLICGVDVTNGAILGYDTTTVWLGSRGIAYDLTATYTLPLNSWTHIAVSRQGTTARLFANGVQIASGTVTKNYPQGLFTVGNYTAFNIGVNGYLYNVRAVKGTAVYTGAFTPPTLPLSTSGAASASAYPSTTNINTTFSSSETSLLLNFTNAGILDNTGKNVLETVGNAQIDTTVKKYGTGSMEFDGSGDRLTNNNFINPDLIMGTGSFTIEGWLYTTSTANMGLLQISTTAGGLQANNTNNIAVYCNNLVLGAYYGGTFRAGTTSISSGTWTHFALVRNGSSINLYVNGTADSGFGTQTDNQNYTGGYIVVGGYFGTSNLFNGYIDDLRITKGVARYIANFTAPTKEFPDQ